MGETATMILKFSRQKPMGQVTDIYIIVQITTDITKCHKMIKLLYIMGILASLIVHLNNYHTNMIIIIHLATLLTWLTI